jgi:hypothetical protein
MRRMMVLLSLATLALILVTVLLPAQSPSTAPVLLAPSATPTLAMCITEDGAGQAVCWWDAQAQGAHCASICMLGRHERKPMRMGQSTLFRMVRIL